MALARLNMPGLVLYGGSIAPGQFQGREVTIQDVFEAVGAHAAGRMTDQEFKHARGRRLPGRGRLRRPVHRQHDGDRLRGARHRARSAAAACRPPIRRRPDVGTRGRRAGRRAGARRGRGRATIITRRAIENAIAVVAATGGSTNAVLHLLAIAKEAGVELTLADFDRISARTPLIADLKPSGRFVATDLHAAGGSPLVIKRLIECRRDRRATRRPSPAARSARKRRAPSRRRARKSCARSTAPLKPHGGLVILFGNLAPEGGVLKLSGTERAQHRGPARVFDSEEAAFDAVQRQAIKAGRRRRDPLRRADRRPGHARDARR